MFTKEFKETMVDVIIGCLLTIWLFANVKWYSTILGSIAFFLPVMITSRNDFFPDLKERSDREKIRDIMFLCISLNIIALSHVIISIIFSFEFSLCNVITIFILIIAFLRTTLKHFRTVSDPVGF